jgi:hypothetical protein
MNRCSSVNGDIKKLMSINKMNPPSIPSHDNVYGYEEKEGGELIK